MEFPRQEYWNEWPFPTPGDLPDSGINPVSPALAGGFFTTVPPGEPVDDVAGWFQIYLFALLAWTVAHQLLCTWNSPGKNTGTGGHFLLQRIFPTQGSNPPLLHLLHWQVDSLPTELSGKP